MAGPDIQPEYPGEKPQADLVLDQKRRRVQQEAAAWRAAHRRRMVITTPGPTTTDVSELVVLQKDFDNQVGSPTGGYIKAEVVIDTATNTISIYVPP